MIRRGRLDDAAALAHIHARALPDDLLPRLGLRYLARAFFPAALSCDGVEVWVAEDAAGPAGVLILARRAGVLERALLSSPRRVAALATALVSRPLLVRELWASARGERWVEGPTNAPPEAEIVLLAVDPRAQSRGLGAALWAETRRTTGAAPIVVKTSAAGAERFYLRSGFVRVGTIARGDRRLAVLVDRGPSVVEAR